MTSEKQQIGKQILGTLVKPVNAYQKHAAPESVYLQGTKQKQQKREDTKLMTCTCGILMHGECIMGRLGL